MSETPKVIVLEAPSVELTLPTPGAVTVYGGGRRLEMELTGRRRPLTVNYRAFTNTVLAACVKPGRRSRC